MGGLSLFQVLQGAAVGLMTPAGRALLLRAFPPAERARVAGILVVPSSSALVPGPVLGGLFVTSLSWRWAFYVNVPVGIAAVVFGLLFLDEQERQEAGAFDARGSCPAAWAWLRSCTGFRKAQVRAGAPPGVIVASAAGVLLLAGPVRVELSRRAGPEHAPRSLGVVIGAPLITRRLYPALGPRRVITGGLAALAAGMAAMSLAGARTDLWLVRLLLCSPP